MARRSTVRRYGSDPVRQHLNYSNPNDVAPYPRDHASARHADRLHPPDRPPTSAGLAGHITHRPRSALRLVRRLHGSRTRSLPTQRRRRAKFPAAEIVSSVALQRFPWRSRLTHAVYLNEYPTTPFCGSTRPSQPYDQMRKPHRRQEPCISEVFLPWPDPTSALNRVGWRQVVVHDRQRVQRSNDPKLNLRLHRHDKLGCRPTDAALLDNLTTLGTHTQRHQCSAHRSPQPQHRARRLRLRPDRLADNRMTHSKRHSHRPSPTSRRS